MSFHPDPQAPSSLPEWELLASQDPDYPPPARPGPFPASGTGQWAVLPATSGNQMRPCGSAWLEGHKSHNSTRTRCGRPATHGGCLRRQSRCQLSLPKNRKHLYRVGVSNTDKSTSKASPIHRDAEPGINARASTLKGNHHHTPLSQALEQETVRLDGQLSGKRQLPWLD